MVSTISDISDWCLEKLEESLLPVNGSTTQKVASYALHIFQFTLFLPLAIITSSTSFTLNHIFYKNSHDAPLVNFAKHPKWSDKPVHSAPIDIGFANADFQVNGPKEHLNTNWSTFYENHAQELSDLGHYPDMWSHPERVIDRLNELGCKSFRFSISRDKIEPVEGQPFSDYNLQHYRNFCRMLTANGIEPMITLNHFSDPTYFSWQRPEDIEGFVNYAKVVADSLYEEGVRKIVTINEPCVVAFQSFVMGEFPPHHKLDFHGAAQVLENMMRAHTRIYEMLKNTHPDLEIGLAHNLIRFRYFHKTNPLWTPIEKILCHYLTEINHGALMRFLETGKFSLKVPFRANYTFEMPQKPPLDFIGLQYYTDPLLKLSFTGGDSVTRVAGEKVSDYQYRSYPQGLASAIEECSRLGVPIDLTEIGADISFNLNERSDEARIRYFDKVFQVIQKALEQNKPVRKLYFWTLMDNLEWHKAWQLRFGFYRFDSKTQEITPRPVVNWLKEKIANQIADRVAAQPIGC